MFAVHTHQVRHPLVEVRWWDIQATTGWTSWDDLPAQMPAACVSAGYLVYEDKFKVILAYDMDSEDFQGVVLPRGCIQSILVVKAPETDLADHAP